MIKKGQETKKGTMNHLETIVKSYGYEYHLVECIRSEEWKLPQPCMFGMKNMALSKVVKIKK